MYPMLRQFAFFLLLQLMQTNVNFSDAYTIPQPRVVALRPRGFRISIPGKPTSLFRVFVKNC